MFTFGMSSYVAFPYLQAFHSSKRRRRYHGRLFDFPIKVIQMFLRPIQTFPFAVLHMFYVSFCYKVFFWYLVFGEFFKSL